MLAMKDVSNADAIAFLKHLYELKPETDDIVVFQHAARNNRISEADALHHHRRYRQDGEKELPFYMRSECWKFNMYPISQTP